MEHFGISTLVVMGIGTVAMAPEIAELAIRLETTADTPGAALGKVTAASQAVLDAVRQHGVDDADLRTHGISVYPQMTPQGQRITGDASRDR